MKKKVIAGVVIGLVMLMGVGIAYAVGMSIDVTPKLKDSMEKIVKEELVTGALANSNLETKEYKDLKVICDGKEYFVFRAIFGSKEVAFLGFHKNGVYYIDGIGLYKDVFKDYCEDGLMDWGEEE